MPHESCVPRTKVSHRPACEHPRENDTWSGHSSVKEPFSPGRAAAGGRPSLAPGEEWPSPPAKEETRLPNGSGMKAPSGRRSPDHSLPITCPNLPAGGYFVKPTFDRISWTAGTVQWSMYMGRRSNKPTPNVCFTLPKVSQHTKAIWPLRSHGYSSFLQTQRSENKRSLNVCLVVRS